MWNLQASDSSVNRAPNCLRARQIKLKRWSTRLFVCAGGLPFVVGRFLICKLILMHFSAVDVRLFRFSLPRENFRVVHSLFAVVDTLLAKDFPLKENDCHQALENLGLLRRRRCREERSREWTYCWWNELEEEWSRWALERNETFVDGNRVNHKKTGGVNHKNTGAEKP